MVKKLLWILLALMLSGALGGCIIRSRDHHRHRGSRASKSGRCHPSQYWDGRTCRHKGKGHGARKHDGRR